MGSKYVCLNILSSQHLSFITGRNLVSFIIFLCRCVSNVYTFRDVSCVWQTKMPFSILLFNIIIKY